MRAMSGGRGATDTPRIQTTEVDTVEQVIVVFLLFIAVLAFGWFYVQRAKARDAAKTPSGQGSPDNTD